MTPDKELLWQNVQENEAAMWERKMQPCSDCKLRWHPSVMTFDHIHRTKHTYSSLASIKQWQPKLFRAELNKCSVVCRNCHYVREVKRDLLDPNYSKRTREVIEEQFALTTAGALVGQRMKPATPVTAPSNTPE